uniref:Uncharacterized protein n=1 Tax=Acrobeloides nanus TaxID=290746 RepID=A0A914EBD4_9BILA
MLTQARKKNNLIKRVISKDKTDIDKWRHIMGEIKTKSEELKQQIKAEWDEIETRLDFIWIFVFELFNLMNLCSLIYFANLPTPDMKDWISGT